MASRRRKAFGVWMLLMDGSAWMFCREWSLEEALITCRTLRTGYELARARLDSGRRVREPRAAADPPLFPGHSVWIALATDPPTVVWTSSRTPRKDFSTKGSR